MQVYNHMYFKVYDVMKHVANTSLIRNDVKNKNGINSEGKHERFCMNCQNCMILQKKKTIYLQV